MSHTQTEKIIRCPYGCQIDSVTRRLNEPSKYSCGHLDLTASITVSGYRETMQVEQQWHRDEATRIIAAHRSA